jgi:acyl-CoA thioester hydrolase
MARFTALVAMRWSDMDAYGHVNNVQFLTYVEEARVEMFKTVPWADTRQADGGIVVAESSIKYLRPLHHRHAPVPIDVWVSKIGAASFRLQYEVHDLPTVDSDPVSSSGARGTSAPAITYAYATSLMVPYNFAEARPRRLDPGEREWLAKYLEEVPAQ